MNSHITVVVSHPPINISSNLKGCVTLPQRLNRQPVVCGSRWLFFCLRNSLDGDLRTFQLRAGISVEHFLCRLKIFFSGYYYWDGWKVIYREKGYFYRFRFRRSLVGGVLASSWWWCEIVRWFSTSELRLFRKSPRYHSCLRHKCRWGVPVEESDFWPIISFI